MLPVGGGVISLPPPHPCHCAQWLRRRVLLRGWEWGWGVGTVTEAWRHVWDGSVCDTLPASVEGVPA